MIPVLQPQWAAEPFAAANYREQLHPWTIVRLLPDLQRVVVARFRRRGDAEGHLKVLRRLNPEAIYLIVFGA